MTQTHINYNGLNGHFIIDVAGTYSNKQVHKDIRRFDRFFEKLKEGTENAIRGQFVPLEFRNVLLNGNNGGF